ncbi:hypothetical protein CVT24_002458, partial [Panaeolus cyanescens]
VLASKTILNFRFNFGTLRSKTTTSFDRVSRSLTPREPPKRFDPPTRHRKSDIVEFVAQQWLGEGSTGIAYRGTAVMLIKADKEGGETKVVSRVLVVKLSHRKKEAITCLRDEYRVYHKLSMKGVRDGILDVHGLFEDSENGAYALVMQDGGVDLKIREYERTGLCEQITMSEEEYNFLLKVILSFNRLGLRHCDIRPSNILMNDKGALFIADFSISDWKSVYLQQDVKNLGDIYQKRFKYGKYGFNDRT